MDTETIAAYAGSCLLIITPKVCQIPSCEKSHTLKGNKDFFYCQTQFPYTIAVAIELS